MQGGTRSYEMARRLVDRGHKVTMITSWREPGRGKSWFVSDEGGIDVHWLPVEYGNEMGYAKRLQAFTRFAAGASQRAASLDTDVIFATSTPLTIALPGVYAARKQKCPMVFEVRDLWPEMPIAIGALKNPLLILAARRLEQFAYRNSDYIVALSPGMAKGVADSGFDAGKIVTIPNGCDLDQFDIEDSPDQVFRAQRPELGDGPIVLYAGALGRVNGVDYMVRLAAATWNLDPSARFVVLGAGSELQSVKALANELGVLGKNFFLYPQVPKAEIGRAFAAASVVTSWIVDLPAAEKNSANKFFDGLAAGRPVCLNHGGWQAELLEEHGAGFSLPRDFPEAASILTSKLADKSGLESSGLAARRLAESEFSRDKLARMLENTLVRASGT